MKTAAGASPLLASQVWTSLILFFIAYGIVFIFYLIFLLGILRKGPEPSDTEEILQPFPYVELEIKK